MSVRKFGSELLKVQSMTSFDLLQLFIVMISEVCAHLMYKLQHAAS